MDSIKCVFVTPEYIDTVVTFSLEYFMQDEPMCRSVGIKESKVIADYFRYVLEQGTSVMAIDTAKENRIVGVRAHRVERRSDQKDGAKSEEEDASSTEGPNTVAVLKLLDLCYDNWNPWDKLDVESFLYLKFLCVDREYRGRNISMKMKDFTFDFMRREKIPLAYVLASSFYSQNVFKKLGFESVSEIRYEDYKIDGKVVFRTEEIHKACVVMIKWVQ